MRHERGPLQDLEHGGRLAAARAAFPDAPRPFLDLSTGINPVPFPVPPLPPDAWARLPEPEETARLERIAARTYGAGEGASVIAGPGTQAFISLLPLTLPGGDVRVLAPTYAEHAAHWRRAGAAVRETATLDALAGADVAILCNPNNPDGRRLPLSSLLRLSARCGLLLIDEAFVDFEPEVESAIPAIDADSRIAVLRSFGKSYGLAGLRLGFLVLPERRAAPVRVALGPWAVSGPALAIGAAALGDAAWAAQAASRCRADAARLDALLGEAGFGIVGGTCLFRLAEAPDAAGWADRLGRAGILVRRFAAFPRWLRFGLPQGRAGWSRLETALGGRLERG